MATGVEVRDAKFYNQLHNGTTFLLNSTDYATTIKGNVGDKVQFTAKIGVYYEAELQSYSLINNTTYVVINMEGASFISTCGFSLGDTVTYARPVLISSDPDVYAPEGFTGVITYLDENKIEIQYTWGIIPPSGQYDGETGYYAHVLLGTTAPESSIYSFCINENDDPFNEFSIIDNTLQAWYNETIVSVFNDGTWKDTLKGQKNGSFRIKSDSATPRNIRFFNVNSVHNYIVQHEFILPYWREDEDENVKNSIPIDDLLGSKSYKYAFKIDLRTVLSNATTSKSAIFENLKGSVGYFDESFNGFSEYYSFSNLVLTDLSNSQTVQSLIANGQTKVNFRVSTTKANFTNTHKLVVGHSYLGLEDEYSKTKTDFETNFMYDTLRLTCGVGASSSLVINNATCTYVDASNIDVEFTIDYPTNYESRLSDTTEFVLWCDVSDLTFYDTSDKIKLKILYGKHSKDSDVLGLANCEVINFFPHTVNLVIGDGFGDYKGFVEDGVGLGFRLQLNDKVDSIDRMQFKLLSVNSSTNEQMELFNRDLDKDTLVKSSGVWVGGYSKGLGYNLNSQDVLNQESLTKIGSNVVGLDNYSVFDFKTAIKIPYQTWISNNDIDLSFFDNTKPNNNLNYLSSNYDNGDWELKACIEMDLTFVDSTTTYQILSPTLTIKDFAESDDYEMNIRTFTEGFTNETFGTILKNQNTIIRAEITQLSGDFTDLTGVWGVIRIEEKDSQGSNNHELSSVVASYDGNHLVPLDGELTAKLEIDSGKIYLTCMTDYSLLSNVNYRISARLGMNSAVVLGAYSIGYSNGYN